MQILFANIMTNNKMQKKIFHDALACVSSPLESCRYVHFLNAIKLHTKRLFWQVIDRVNACRTRKLKPDTINFSFLFYEESNFELRTIIIRIFSCQPSFILK